MTNDKDGAALLRDLVMAMEQMEPATLDMFRLEPGAKLLREWIGKAPTAALKSHGQAFDAADKTKSTRADIEGLAYDVHHHWSVGHKDEAVAAILRFCPLVDTAGVREACAKVADGNVMSGNDQWSAGHDAAARKIAHAIRSIPLS